MVEEESEFEKKSQDLLEIFRLNIIKAVLISEIKKESLESSIIEGFAGDIAILDSTVGTENIAKSQAIVMMITSLEAFLRDFFKLMVLREDVLKKALRKCDVLKANSTDLLKLIKKNTYWPELIISKEKLSFQNFKSLIRAFRMLGLEFEDILEDNLREVNTLLGSNEEDSPRQIILFGEEVFKELVNIRHKVVHESRVFQIQDLDLDNYILFLEFLGGKIHQQFFQTDIKYAYKKFQITSAPAPEETNVSKGVSAFGGDKN